MQVYICMISCVAVLVEALAHRVQAKTIAGVIKKIKDVLVHLCMTSFVAGLVRGEALAHRHSCSLFPRLLLYTRYIKLSNHVVIGLQNWQTLKGSCY